AAHRFEDTFLHYSRYQAAFLDRDAAAQQRELSWGKGVAGGEDILLSTQSDTEGYFGRLRKAREFSKQAVDSALGNKRNHPAAICEINRGHPARAAELLPNARYDLAGAYTDLVPGTMYPVYVRGQVYLLLHRGNEASAEFQKILDHSGFTMNFPLGALAHLQLGRAYAMKADTA